MQAMPPWAGLAVICNKLRFGSRLTLGKVDGSCTQLNRPDEPDSVVGSTTLIEFN